MDAFDLVAKIILDTSEFTQGLSESKDKMSSFASRLGEKIGKAAKVGAVAVGAVTAATTAMGAAFLKGAGDVASYGDKIDKASQKMGMSAQAYQEWDAILQHSGTSIDSMARGMTTLSKAAESNAKEFQALGISQEQLASMSQEELFAKTIEGLQNMESGTERTVLAQKLLGGSAKELGALLNTSAEDTEAMRQRVHELGGVMSDDAVKAAAAYQDQLQDLQTAFSGISRGLLSNFLPSITTVMSGLTEIFAGNGDSGVALVKEGVDGIIKGIEEALPQLMTVGGEILSALGQALAENAPNIIQAGTEIIVNLAAGLISSLPTVVSTIANIGVAIIDTLADMAPELLESGMEMLVELAEGILEGAPQAISSFFTVISKLVAYIMQNLPQFASKGVELVGRLAQGIINNAPAIVAAIGSGISKVLSTIVQNLPQFLAKGGEIVRKIASGIQNALSSLLSPITSGINQMKSKFTSTNWASIGLDIMRGIANGIRNGLSSALNAAGEAARSILQKAKNALGIKSPSTVFRDIIGKNITAGIAQGILDTIPVVNAAMDDLDDELVAGLDDVDIGADTTVTAIGDGSANNNSKVVNNSFVFNVDGAESPEEWADRAVRELQMKVRMA